MPARTSLAPGAFPERFARFSSLPQSEIPGISLLIIHFNAGPGQHIFDFPAGQSAVILESGNIIIHIAAQYIGMALFNQGFHHMDNIIHMFRYPWIHIGPAYMERIHDLEIRIDVTVGNSLPVRAFRIGFIDNLIIHISKILYELHLVAHIFQVAANHIPGHCRTGIADMGMIVGRYAAHINLRFPWCNRFKYFLFLRQRVIHFNFFHLDSSICRVIYLYSYIRKI